VRNCIYSSGEVVSLESGACMSSVVDEDGFEHELVDIVDSSTDVLVETEAPGPSYGMLAALLLVVVVGASLTRR